jgi:hypothetical protein
VSTPRRNRRPPRLPCLWGHPLTGLPSNQILDHSVQNHPEPVSFLSSGVSSRSGLQPLNPTIDHTYICVYKNIYTVDTSGVNRLASQICHNRLFRKKLQHNHLLMISTEVSSLVTHNTELHLTRLCRTEPVAPALPCADLLGAASRRRVLRLCGWRPFISSQ